MFPIRGLLLPTAQSSLLHSEPELNTTQRPNREQGEGGREARGQLGPRSFRKRTNGTNQSTTVSLSLPLSFHNNSPAAATAMRPARTTKTNAKRMVIFGCRERGESERDGRGWMRFEIEKEFLLVSHVSLKNFVLFLLSSSWVSWVLVCHGERRAWAFSKKRGLAERERAGREAPESTRPFPLRLSPFPPLPPLPPRPPARQQRRGRWRGKPDRWR